jgi:hypothetical protein
MQKKAIFALPNIIIDEDIIINENFKLTKATEAKCKNHFRYNFDNLTVISIENSEICASYDKNIHEKILNIIEKIKFTYFFKHVNAGAGYPGFISVEAFDLYVLLEKNQDSSFEHKMPITNGLTTFLMSLDEYYKYKNILGNITRLTIHTKSFEYFHIFDNCNDDTKLLIMELYTKCRKISTLDNFSRIIFARTSIEVMVKDISEISLKTYASDFIIKSKKLIEKNIQKNTILFSLNETLNFDKTKYILEEHMKELAQQRHNIVHDGEKYINTSLEVYFVWFPLFFTLMYYKLDNKIEFSLSVRILLFLNLLSIDVKSWNEFEGNKKTCLYSYEENANKIPKLINDNETEYLEAYIKAFQNCLTEKANKTE